MREDFQQYYKAAVRLALAYPGLTDAEYDVMCHLAGDFSDTPSGLARSMALLNENQNEALYLEAVSSLIQKEYALVLDEVHIAQMRKEIQREDITACDFLMPDNCFHPGDVDLTERGYLAYRDVSMKVSGWSVHVNEAGWVDNEQGIVKVYATLEWAFYTRIGQAILQLQEEGKRIVAVHEPVSLGRWRPNRFITYPSGICTVIEYTTTTAQAVTSV